MVHYTQKNQVSLCREQIFKKVKWITFSCTIVQLIRNSCRQKLFENMLLSTTFDDYPCHRSPLLSTSLRTSPFHFAIQRPRAVIDNHHNRGFPQKKNLRSEKIIASFPLFSVPSCGHSHQHSLSLFPDHFIFWKNIQGCQNCSSQISLLSPRESCSIAVRGDHFYLF